MKLGSRMSYYSYLLGRQRNWLWIVILQFQRCSMEGHCTLSMVRASDHKLDICVYYRRLIASKWGLVRLCSSSQDIYSVLFIFYHTIPFHFSPWMGTCQQEAHTKGHRVPTCRPNGHHTQLSLQVLEPCKMVYHRRSSTSLHLCRMQQNRNRSTWSYWYSLR